MCYFSMNETTTKNKQITLPIPDPPPEALPRKQIDEPSENSFETTL